VLLATRNFEGKRISFGINNENADLRAVNISADRGRYSFDILKGGKLLCPVSMAVTGYHNIYNALATAAVAVASGLSTDDIKRGLEAFRGAKRRMEYKGKLSGADVYDDYGHHPTEVKTTLEGAKKFAEGRLWCVFQSHTYSRTKALLDEFALAFDAADKVIIVDIYPARETDDLGISGKTLAIRIGEKAEYAPDLQFVAQELHSALYPGDALVVMGAGNIYRIFEYLEFDE
jgi:UDP-N-acetylmuramate--alanine ligase